MKKVVKFTVLTSTLLLFSSVVVPASIGVTEAASTENVSFQPIFKNPESQQNWDSLSEYEKNEFLDSWNRSTLPETALDDYLTFYMGSLIDSRIDRMLVTMSTEEIDSFVELTEDIDLSNKERLYNELKEFTESLADSKKPLEETPAHFEAANDYVTFDDSKKEFVVNSELEKELNKDDLADVNNKVTETNQQIEETLASSDDETVIQAVDPDGTTTQLSETSPVSTAKFGKNGVKFYWYKTRVYLNASTFKTAVKFGAGLGGIWIPGRIVKTVMWGLALTPAKIKNGVWFDLHFIAWNRPILIGFGWQ